MAACGCQPQHTRNVVQTAHKPPPQAEASARQPRLHAAKQGGRQTPNSHIVEQHPERNASRHSKPTSAKQPASQEQGRRRDAQGRPQLTASKNNHRQTRAKMTPLLLRLLLATLHLHLASVRPPPSCCCCCCCCYTCCCCTCYCALGAQQGASTGSAHMAVLATQRHTQQT